MWVVERESFWEDLGEAVPETAIFNFRGCYTGEVVESLAELTGRTVTGVTGLLQSSDSYPNPEVPDYTFEGDLVMAYDLAGTIQTTVEWPEHVGTKTVWEDHTVIYWHEPMIVLLPVKVPIPNPEPNPY